MAGQLARRTTSAMPSNVEIKARVGDAAKLFARAQVIADHGPVEIFQDDTFFACATGRLKLRWLSPSEGQLIFYQRADAKAPKESRYVIVPTATPDLLRDTLIAALGLRGRVRKKRLLFMLGNTRIHLDDVADLGHFLELEVVLRNSETAAQGAAIARDIMERLGVDADDLVDRAYVDLFPSIA
jgi:predicted adenylyl cyclase CyaB